MDECIEPYDHEICCILLVDHHVKRERDRGEQKMIHERQAEYRARVKAKLVIGVAHPRLHGDAGDDEHELVHSEQHGKTGELPEELHPIGYGRSIGNLAQPCFAIPPDELYPRRTSRAPER